jgi:hypothetical protein
MIRQSLISFATQYILVSSVCLDASIPSISGAVCLVFAYATSDGQPFASASFCSSTFLSYLGIPCAIYKSIMPPECS